MYCIRLRKLTNQSDKNSPAIFGNKSIILIFNCHFIMRVPLRQVIVRKNKTTKPGKNFGILFVNLIFYILFFPLNLLLNSFVENLFDFLVLFDCFRKHFSSFSIYYSQIPFSAIQDLVISDFSLIKRTTGSKNTVILCITSLNS